MGKVLDLSLDSRNVLATDADIEKKPVAVLSVSGASQLNRRIEFALHQNEIKRSAVVNLAASQKTK